MNYDKLNQYFNIKIENDVIDDLYKNMTSFERLSIGLNKTSIDTEIKDIKNHQKTIYDLCIRMSNIYINHIDIPRQTNETTEHPNYCSCMKYIRENIKKLTVILETLNIEYKCYSEETYYKQMSNIEIILSKKCETILMDVITTKYGYRLDKIKQYLQNINKFVDVYQPLGLDLILTNMWIDDFFLNKSILDMREPLFQKETFNIIKLSLDELDKYYDTNKIQKPANRYKELSVEYGTSDKIEPSSKIN